MGRMRVATGALGYAEAQAIKLKLAGDGLDGDRVEAARAARPDVWLGIDANQGLSRVTLLTLMPRLVAARGGADRAAFSDRQRG